MTLLSKRSWTDSTSLKRAVPSFTLCHLAHRAPFQSQGDGSIAQLADSEFVPSSPSPQPSSLRETPVSDITHDTLSALPYGSPMSDALSPPSPPSPLPLDEEMEPVARTEDLSPNLSGSRPLSPDASMEVTEEVSIEVPDEEPPPPPAVDSDLPVDASTRPPSPSSEVALTETRAETPQAEALSDAFEGTETMDSVAPSEAAPVQQPVQSDEDTRSEGLASPVITERLALEDEDMDVDVVGEPSAEADEPVLPTTERSQSPLPLTPQASETEIQPSPSPPPSAPVPAPPPVPLRCLLPRSYFLPSHLPKSSFQSRLLPSGSRPNTLWTWPL